TDPQASASRKRRFTGLYRSPVEQPDGSKTAWVGPSGRGLHARGRAGFPGQRYGRVRQMRALLRFVLGFGFVLLTASGVRAAACDPNGVDAQAVADARADVAAQCDCVGAENHGTYV